MQACQNPSGEAVNTEQESLVDGENRDRGYGAVLFWRSLTKPYLTGGSEIRKGKGGVRLSETR